MRTRTSWLTLLLMVGLTLSPKTAFGQGGLDYVPPDPVWPIPTFSSRPENGGPFTFGEFVMFRQTNPLRHQTIATRGFIDQDGSTGFGPPGTYIGDGSVALEARQAGGPNSYQPGFNIGLGWKFRDGSVVDVSWMHLAKKTNFAGAALIGGPLGFNPGLLLQNTFLTAQVFNFPIEYAGPATDLAVGNPNATFGIWNAADHMTIEFNQRTEQIQGRFRVPVFETENCRTYGLTGARFFWIWERFKWRTVDADITGAASAFDVAQYTNIVSNRMYGPFVGCGTEYYCGSNRLGAYAISLDLDAALLLDVVKERAKYELGEKFAPPQSKRSITDYKIVPEVSAAVKLWWYPAEGIQIQVGWDFMAFFNTIAGRNPVDFDYSRVTPAWERVPVRFFDGFRAGIGFIW